MEESKDWFRQAEKDLDTAKFNLDGGKIEAGVFFLQQSAEKALKAVYINKFKKLLKVHDCKKLGPAYQYTRYPDVLKVENLNELASEFFDYTKEILKWAKKNT